MRYQFNIARQSLGDAATDFARSTGLQIARFSDVDAAQTSPIVGSYTAQQALDVMLTGTGLTYRFINDHTIAIVKPDIPPTQSVTAAAAAGSQTSNATTERGASSMKRSSIFSRFAAFVGSFAAAMSSTSTYAQVGEDDAPVALEEIIVTAERRSENLQKTPLAVTAVTGEQLESQGINNLADLGAQVPGLQTGPSGQVFLRGVGSTNLNETGDQAVAYHIDGIYVPRAQSAAALFYDVERVEVLRGPQGTLWGRNATVGAINVISRRPTNSFEGSASVDAGNHGSVIMNGTLNVPVSDMLAFRAALQTNRHDGYIDNINPNVNDGYDQDDRSARVSMLFKPLDTLSIYLSADYLRRNGAVVVTGGSNSSAAILERVGFASDVWKQTFNIPTSMNDKYSNLTSEVNWEVAGGTVTYLGGYRTEKRDEYAQSYQANGTSQPTWFVNDESAQSHELRYAGDVGRFKWVTGLYYFAEKNNVDFRVNLYSGTGRQFYQPFVRARSSAAFGQGTYSVTDTLRLTAGVRYTKDHKARIGQINVLTNGVATSVATINQADYDWNATNWKVGVDYDLTPSAMAYFNAGTGYKAGGYFDGLPPNSYEPEKLMAYEAGVKSRFFDDRVQLNASAYLYDYQDFQVSSQIFLTPTIPAGATVNAEKARIKGLDLESKFSLTANDRLDLTLGWLNARYTSFYLPNGDGFSNAGLAATAPRVPVDFSGTEMAKAPEWTVNLGYEHSWDLGSGATLSARVQSHYESHKYLEYHHFAFNEQDAYTKSDLSVTYAAPEDVWSLMAYVRNIENDEVKTSAFPLPLAGGPQYTASMYAPPRLYGARVSVKF